jgi:transposase
MSRKATTTKKPAEQVIKDIRRATSQHFSAEDKIRVVLDGLRSEDSIAELCRKEGIAQSLYFTWSKEFMEAGKRRLAGDTARAASSNDVKGDIRPNNSRTLPKAFASPRLVMADEGNGRDNVRANGDCRDFRVWLA